MQTNSRSKRPYQRRRFSNEQIAAIRRDLAAGKSLREVAALHGCSKQYASDLKRNLNRKGVGVDASTTKARHASRGARLADEMHRLYNKGKSQLEIAALLDISLDSVSYHLRDLRKKHFDNDTRQTVIDAIEKQGMAWNEAIEVYGVSRSTIARYLREERMKAKED